MAHEELLRVYQVAAVLKKSTGYVYRLIRHKALPAVRLGNLVLVRRRDLLWYLRVKMSPSLARELLMTLEHAQGPEQAQVPGPVQKPEVENERG